MLSDTRDESAENIRIVIEPKSRNLSPEMIMETLFKKTDLEVKVSLNLNVIDHKNIPGVKNMETLLKKMGIASHFVHHQVLGKH